MNVLPPIRWPGVAGARSNLSAPAAHDASRLKQLAPPVGMPPRIRIDDEEGVLRVAEVK